MSEHGSLTSTSHSAYIFLSDLRQKKITVTRSAHKDEGWHQFKGCKEELCARNPGDKVSQLKDIVSRPAAFWWYSNPTITV